MTRLRHPGRRITGLFLALGLCLSAVLTSGPAAQAATGSPPVTTPDAGSMYPGNAVFVTPIVNDTDPDGDELVICRLGTEKYKGLAADFQGNDLGVFSRPSVKPGTYTFTYYACDFSYLTAGTVTVTVEAPPNIRVKKIEGRPGKLRVTNPAPFKIRFLYGSLQEDEPDGTIAIPQGTSVVITVHRTKIAWIALTRRGDFLKIGRVDNIELPPGDHPPAAGRAGLSRDLAEAWRTA